MSELRLVELYCGIGGAAAALARSGVAVRGVGAFDISEKAVAVYRHNFPGHRAEVRLVDSLPADRLRRLEADLFWLSPPCQPYTRRGHQRHLADPRAATFLAALELVAACRPPYVALENVVGFEASEARERLLALLDAAGYGTVQERLLCPSELGWPNRRPRYYLLAARCPFQASGPHPPAPLSADGEGGEPIREGVPPSSSPFSNALQGAPLALSPLRPPLVDLLDPCAEPDLALAPEIVARYEGALDRVDPADPAAVASCFTAAYGRSFVHSGSYLALPDGGLRRFSPNEVLRLLGFPPGFAWPQGLSRQLAWRLAGNSLSLPAVQAVLASLPIPR